jgi:hypothetical protein
MKWTCPNCPELNHGTRHESVFRHIRRKHQSIGEPINLNSGLTRRQMGLKSNCQAPHLGGLQKGPPFYALSNVSESRTFDFYDRIEKQFLRPLRQLVEMRNLLNQNRANSLQGNLQNVAQSISTSYTGIEIQKRTIVDLFGCKAFVCIRCCSLEVHPFYFDDPKEVKSRSTIEHTCPTYSYTKLSRISDDNKKIVRDQTKQLNLVYILRECALNHWSINGILYLLGIKISNSYVQSVKIVDFSNECNNKSFAVQYLQKEIIELDYIAKDHWANKVIGRGGGVNEVSIYDMELENFLIATNYATFGFFRIKNSDEIYFIMLANHARLTMTLVNQSK